jgi:hypothetical protein
MQKLPTGISIERRVGELLMMKCVLSGLEGRGLGCATCALAGERGICAWRGKGNVGYEQATRASGWACVGWAGFGWVFLTLLLKDHGSTFHTDVMFSTTARALLRLRATTAMNLLMAGIKMVTLMKLTMPCASSSSIEALVTLTL